MSCAERAYRACPLLGTRRLGGELFELRAAWPGPEPLPGQFFMLRASRSAVLLGRPISVFAAEPGALSFVIAERGAGTMELAELRVGEELLLEGPLGSSWDLGVAGWSRPLAASGRPAAASNLTGASPSGPASAPSESGSTRGAEGRMGDHDGAEALDPKPLALVGGGVGLAPLVFLARGLRPGSYDLYAGFRSASWGLGGLEPRELRLFTEDGSEGKKGRVLDGFVAGAYSAILACGPEPMLRRSAELAAAAGVPAWLSLERRMACGVGACLGCTVRTKAGNRRACVEGPVFRAEELTFDE